MPLVPRNTFFCQLLKTLAVKIKGNGESNMIGNKYRLFGTTTIFEIEGDDGSSWNIKVYVEGDEDNAVQDVRMSKQDLQDSINMGQFELV